MEAVRRLKRSTMRRYGVLGVRKRVVRGCGCVYFPWEGRYRTLSGREGYYNAIGVDTPAMRRTRAQFGWPRWRRTR